MGSHCVNTMEYLMASGSIPQVGHSLYTILCYDSRTRVSDHAIDFGGFAIKYCTGKGIYYMTGK